MKAILLGIGGHMDFTTNDGNRIVGTNIFVGFEDENTQGLRTEKYFLKDSVVLPKDLKPKDQINLSFNFKGKIDEVTKVTA